MVIRHSLPGRTHARLLLALLVWLVAGPAQAPPDAPPPEHPLFAGRDLFRPDQLVLTLEPGRGAAPDLADGSPLAAVLARYGATGIEAAFSDRSPGAVGAARSRARFPVRAARAPLAQRAPALENVFLVQLSGPTDVLQAIAEVAALPGVSHAETNAIYRSTLTPLPEVSYRPDDPHISQDGVHWSEGAWGRDFPDLYGLERVRAMQGWSAFDLDGSGAFEAGEAAPGEGVVVAVVDSGLDTSHPDIRDNVWHNDAEIPDNGLDDDANGFVDDVQGWDFVNGDADPRDGNGHGTHVSGTVAARADDGIGVAGVAPFARVMALKGLSDLGSGSAVQLANAIRYAADMGADVVSGSWGGTVDSEILHAAFRYAHGLGVVLVVSAGNNSVDIGGVFPASYAEVIAVAATDAQDQRAFFSNVGRVGLAAPGVQVLSLNANGGDNAIARAFPERVVGGGYLHLSGTSMSCPHVSGAAAVLLSRRPGETRDEIRARLRAGAVSLDATNPDFAGRLGAGRLDVASSLDLEPRPLVEVLGVDARDLAPGSAGDVEIRLENQWSQAFGVTARIHSESSQVTVSKDTAHYGDLPTRVSVSNVGDAFRLALDAATPYGSSIPFTLELTGEDGYAESFALSFAVTQFADVSVEVELPLFEVVPWSVGLRDFDQDGDVDAHFIGFFGNAFFRNTGGVFSFAPDTGLVTPTIGSSQALFLDVENDGAPDIFWAGFNDFSGSLFFQNTGGGTFSDVTDASGSRGLRAFTAAALDYDGDGLVDFLGGSTSRGGGLAGQALFLMRNNGDGTFSDRAAEACLDTSSALLLGQSFVLDYDGDGLPDLLLVSPERVDLYRNQGDGSFEDVTRRVGLVPRFPSERACRWLVRARSSRQCREQKALGGAVGDYDDDGDIDIFLTGRGLDDRVRFNTLYRNDGKHGFEDVTLLSGDLATAEVSGMPRGNAFFDYDNDGDLDLYMTNEGITSDRRNKLFRNEGDGTFTDVTDLAFVREKSPGGAAAAIGDYNGDGALDLYAPAGQLSLGGQGAFFENRFAQQNHWLGIRLEGRVSHRDAYGARVEVTSDGRTRMRERHQQAADAEFLHFGLGDATEVEEIRVRWPSGILQTLPGGSIDRVLDVVEPAGCDAPGAECPVAAPRTPSSAERFSGPPKKRKCR